MVTTVAVLVMDQVPTQKPAFVNDDFSKAIILSLMSFFIIPFDDDFSKVLLVEIVAEKKLSKKVKLKRKRLNTSVCVLGHMHSFRIIGPSLK